MTIDARTPEDRRRELANISLMQAKNHIERLQDELAYLIATTATGPRREVFCDANIHAMSAWAILSDLKSIEKE